MLQTQRRGRLSSHCSISTGESVPWVSFSRVCSSVATASSSALVSSSGFGNSIALNNVVSPPPMYALSLWGLYVAIMFVTSIDGRAAVVGDRRWPFKQYHRSPS